MVQKSCTTWDGAAAKTLEIYHINWFAHQQYDLSLQVNHHFKNGGSFWKINLK